MSLEKIINKLNKKLFLPIIVSSEIIFNIFFPSKIFANDLNYTKYYSNNYLNPMYEILNNDSNIVFPLNENNSSFPIGDSNFSVGYTIGLSYNCNEFKISANFSLDNYFKNFTNSIGIGITYHSNLYNTKKKGIEIRTSAMTKFEYDNFIFSIGTNLWSGFGELKEFNQRSGIVSIGTLNNSITYENDGFPFNYIYLSNDEDSYRTHALSIKIKNISLNTKLFTGKRIVTKEELEERKNKNEREKNISGEFKEFYKYGFVNEIGEKYRYGSFTINYNGLGIGLNSEWIRHFMQNIVGHGILRPQRQFVMIDDKIEYVINVNSAPTKFSQF